MALFGPNRKKSLWNTINGLPTDMQPIDDPTRPIANYEPTGAQSDPSIGDVGGPPKTKFFGQGGVGRGIAGSIGDYLLQMSHMQPVYAPAMQQQREMEQRTQQYQQQRQGSMEDWKAQQEYEAAHQKPAGPTELERNVTYFRSIGREDLAKAVMAKAGAMSGTNAAGQPVVMNPTSLFEPAPGGGQQSSPPHQGGSTFTPGQVINGMRFKGGDDTDPNNYEPVGGAGSQAPRGFLGRRR